jgi:hypothetical protein
MVMKAPGSTTKKKCTSMTDMTTIDTITTDKNYSH